MSDMARRSFLRAAGGAGLSLGIGAAVGDLPVPAAAPATEVGHRAGPPDPGGPVVACLRDLSAGAVTVYVGTREITVHDRRLADRLARAAATGATP